MQNRERGAGGRSAAASALLNTSIALKQRLEFFISFGVSLFSSLCSFLADALRLCYAFV